MQLHNPQGQALGGIRGIGGVHLRRRDAHEDKLYDDPNFYPTFVHLIDSTGITQTKITAPEMSTLARRTGFSPKARKALVVNTVLSFGLARIFEAYLQLSGTTESVSVFKERDKALEWLGITGEV